MPSANADRPEPKRRFWTLEKKGIAAACAFFAVAAVVVAGARARSNRETERRMAAARADIAGQIAALKAEGAPVELLDLAPPEIPEKENAAVALVNAFALMKANEQREQTDPAIKNWDLPLFTDEPFEPHRDEVARALKLHAGAMRLAREALRRTRCRYPVDYSEGVAADLRHLGKLRHMARLFCGEALLEARSGRTTEATRGIRTVLALARTLDEEPCLVSKLVQIAVACMAIDTLGKVARASQLPDDCRRTVIDDLDSLDLFGSLERGLAGERACIHGTFMGVLEGADVQEDLLDAAREIRERPADALDELADVLRQTTRTMEALRQPSWHALRTVRRMEALLGQRIAEDRADSLGIRAGSFAAWAACHRAVAASAMIHVARVGLACELYRSKHGEYPAKLDALAPEFIDKVPPDPFTGKPFVYRRTGDGFVVYSVGENLKDDGGVKDLKAGKDDILWTSRAGGTVGE